MGLIDNTKRIETALTEKNRKEQEKERQKRLKELEKENKERFEKDIIQEIKSEFEKYLNDNGVDYITEFYSIERKNKIYNDILQNYGEPITTYFINKNTGKTEIKVEKYKNEREIKQIFDNNYYKILKEQKDIYEKNEKYLYKKLMQEQIKQQQQQKPEFKKLIFKLFCYAFSLPRFIYMVYCFSHLGLFLFYKGYFIKRA